MLFSATEALSDGFRLPPSNSEALITSAFLIFVNIFRFLLKHLTFLVFPLLAPMHKMILLRPAHIADLSRLFELSLTTYVFVLCFIILVEHTNQGNKICAS